MEKNIFRKSLAIGIIILFFGASITPCSGEIENSHVVYIKEPWDHNDNNKGGNGNGEESSYSTNFWGKILAYSGVNGHEDESAWAWCDHYTNWVSPTSISNVKIEITYEYNIDLDFNKDGGTASLYFSLIFYIYSEDGGIDEEYEDIIYNLDDGYVSHKQDGLTGFHRFYPLSIIKDKSYTIGVIAYIDTSAISNPVNPMCFSKIKIDHYAYEENQTKLAFFWENRNPDNPNKPSGESRIRVNELHSYTTSGDDIDGRYELLSYTFFWGDGDDSGWVGPASPNVEVTAGHWWKHSGEYCIDAKAGDQFGGESDRSLKFWITVTKDKGVPKGTQITMLSSGPATKNIEDIRVGDYILSYDPISQTITEAEVIKVYNYPEGLPEYNLIFNDNLEVTPGQTLYIDQAEGKEMGEWTQVKGDNLGDYIWMEANDTELRDYMLENIPGETSVYPVPIISREYSTGPAVPIYDLDIRPLQGEACGYWANGILVGGYN